MSRFVSLILLIGLSMYSAIQIVVVRQENRVLFIELQTLRDTRKRLDEEWSQLLLEQATWGTHGRVEQIARQQLQMINPPSNKVYGIQL